MRKVLSGVLATLIVLSVGTTTAFAAGAGGGRYFVDADGDGVCDVCGTYHRRGMAGTGCGRTFVDADGDGICDHYVSGQCPGSGYGCGSQGRCGNGFRGGHGR